MEDIFIMPGMKNQKYSNKIDEVRHMARIVKQIYAGWIGVEHNGIVDNGGLVFELTPERNQQLITYNPTNKELYNLKKRMDNTNSKFRRYLD